MKIEYRKADITDSELLIDIYNFAFLVIILNMVNVRRMERLKR